VINFNVPTVSGDEISYIEEAINSKKLCGNGNFTRKCHRWFEENLKCARSMFTPSCTHALEMSAILIDIKEGDEVIMPSFTFVSTANAFVLRGAKIIFIDVRPDTMNIDENKIEQAVTKKTKAIVPVHYAGVACEMDTIMDIAARHNLYVIEDAAQGMMSTYKGKPLGTIGNFGAYSFHETKNYTSGGEGGLLIINDETFVARAEIIREKGTNRNLFLKGMVDKYTWVDVGSSFLPSELNAAYLYAQLQRAVDINENRLESWKTYYDELKPLSDMGLIEIPKTPSEIKHNGHMFYLKVKDGDMRSELIEYLKINGIMSVFHYIPLHSSKAGKNYGEFVGDDVYTTKDSDRLLRLPLYYNMSNEDVLYVSKMVRDFIFKEKQKYL
jgi:dTDP-4-amino-4,6-dideoxygalactose transaminase